MNSRRPCPICTDTFERKTDLTVHLEVEHRKSELATHLVSEYEDSSTPMVEPEDERQSDNRPTPPL